MDGTEKRKHCFNEPDTCNLKRKTRNAGADISPEARCEGSAEELPASPIV